MENISVFDVVGPVMIGPSSSHTAGAVRMAALARKIVHGDIVRAEITLYGSFAATYKGHGTDRALVAGLLGFLPDDPRIRDAFAWAAREGLAYSFAFDHDDNDVHPNTADMVLTRRGGAVHRVRGVSTGGGAAEIRSIDGVEMVMTGEFNTILVRQRDEPGVVAHIARSLSDAGVNIAFMRLYREARGGAAYTIVETDQAIPAEAMRTLERYPSIVSANLIEGQGGHG